MLTVPVTWQTALASDVLTVPVTWQTTIASDVLTVRRASFDSHVYLFHVVEKQDLKHKTQTLFPLWLGLRVMSALTG